MNTGLELLNLKVNTTVFKAMFTPDGGQVLAATQDGRILGFDSAPL
jgi:hypothetical protein